MQCPQETVLDENNYFPCRIQDLVRDDPENLSEQS